MPAPATGSFYARAPFDPSLILAQIIVLQSVFYISFVRSTQTHYLVGRETLPVHDLTGAFLPFLLCLDLHLTYI